MRLLVYNISDKQRANLLGEVHLSEELGGALGRGQAGVHPRAVLGRSCKHEGAKAAQSDESREHVARKEEGKRLKLLTVAISQGRFQPTSKHMASELDALTAAINVIADARSAHDARTRATALVEEYKIKYPALDQLGLSLATPHAETDPPKEPYIRFVGLQLVEHYVLSRWNGLSDADKEAFKTGIVPQLFSVTLPVGAEQMYIFEKVAKIISDVAMREWPQRWTSLTDDLVAAAGMGSQHALVTLVVLRTLAENVQTYNDDLPTARKNDLVSMQL